MIDNLTCQHNKVFILLSKWISRQLDPEHLAWLQQKQQQIVFNSSDSSGQAFFLPLLLYLVL